MYAEGIARTRKWARTFVPRLECLEERCTPTTLAVHGSTLLVLGDNNANTIAITDDGHGNVSATLDGNSVSGTGIKHVVVNTRGGDDTVTYTLTGQLTQNEKLQFQLGKGTDKLTLDFSKGLANSHLAVDVNGHGTDTVTSTFGDFNNSNLYYRANLGKGDDSVVTTLAGNILGTSQVRFNVNTGKGDDTVQFNAQGATNPNGPPSGVKIDSGAALDINVNGGKGADTITVNYEGVDNGKLGLNLRGGPGADTITANVTADAGSTGSIRAVERGGPGDDNLTLNVTDNSGSGGTSTLGSLFALIDGGPGHNTLTHTANVKVVGGQV
jgi:hypothetical protein